MVKIVKRLTLAGIFLLAACVTVNIYFPAAAIQKAADEIVEDVRGTDEKQEPDRSSGNHSWLHGEHRRFALSLGEAYAQINIEVSTPAIRNLTQSLKNTYPLLKPFYDRGNIGENNSGFLEARSTEGVGLKEKADLARLVEQENGNRLALYGEIMRANNLKEDSLPQIQRIFANSWRAKSQPAWWVQGDDGQWVRKP
jgi:uncharacterized protein